ncbi:hypothetical protein OQA88_1020 [Cercophora sp. LCS_1]
MQIKKALCLAAAQQACAQSLSDVLASHNNSLSTLVSLLGQQPELVNTLAGLQGITILAPSDQAFSAILADPAVAAKVQSDPGFVATLLTYHVLNGTFYASDLLGASDPAFVPTLMTDPAFSTVSGGQRLRAQAEDGTVVITTGNGAEAKVQATDFNFTGGTIHVIDNVLSIPPNLTDALAENDLTSLTAAVVQANLVNTLSDLDQLTLFAPNNAAFDAISAVAANLTIEELTAVLGYHVIPGVVVYSSDVGNGTAQTVQGGEVTFTVQGNGIFVNDAQVVKPNILVKNGVVHVIDEVLIPSNANATPTSTGIAPSATGTVVTGAAGMNSAALGEIAVLAAAAGLFNL